MSGENPGYYAVIPMKIMHNKDLPDGAKLLYGEISALCNLKGFCWATSATFSRHYEVSERTIIRWINALVECGYIHRNIRKGVGVEGKDRRCLSIIPLHESEPLTEMSPVSEMSVEGCQKCQATPDINVTQNIKKNTKTITKEITPKAPSCEALVNESSLSDSVKSTLCEWLGYKEEKRQPYKPRGLQALITQVAKHCKQHGDAAVVDCISLSMANNWQGIVWDRLQKAGAAKSNNPNPSYTKGTDLDDFGGDDT